MGWGWHGRRRLGQWAGWRRARGIPCLLTAAWQRGLMAGLHVVVGPGQQPYEAGLLGESICKVCVCTAQVMRVEWRGRALLCHCLWSCALSVDGHPLRGGSRVGHGRVCGRSMLGQCVHGLGQGGSMGGRLCRSRMACLSTWPPVGIAIWDCEFDHVVGYARSHVSECPDLAVGFEHRVVRPGRLQP